MVGYTLGMVVRDISMEFHPEKPVAGNRGPWKTDQFIWGGGNKINA